VIYKTYNLFIANYCQKIIINGEIEMKKLIVLAILSSLLLTGCIMYTYNP